MPVTPSPLRYPGGKTSIQNMISSIILENNLQKCIYAEPYAGGGGLALSLLFKGYVNEIVLNDFDRSIWSLWYSILNFTDEFIKKIESVPIEKDEWICQKEVQNNKKNAGILELGFSTFFLNRTNRSGIIEKAGMIGGIDQKGKYKIDCRFNKEVLIKKIRRIQKYKKKINVFNLDALDFINKTKSTEDIFYCIDPPYYSKGSSLYTNFYEKNDHMFVSKAILALDKPWILTYDNSDNIMDLYKSLPLYTFNLNYSAAVKSIGTELFIANRGLKIPHSIGLNEVA